MKKPQALAWTSLLILPLGAVLLNGHATGGTVSGGKKFTNPVGTSPPPTFAENALYDFNTVPADQVVMHHFVLTNRSERRVKISGISVSCSCTSARASTTVIDPGRRSVITMSYLPPFDLRGSYRDAKEAMVYLEGYSGPAAILQMKGTIRCSLTAKPDEFIFGRVPVGTSHKQTITIYLDKSKNVQVLSGFSAASVSLPVRISKPRTTHDGFKVQQVTAMLPESCPIGEITGNIVLRTNSKRSPVMETPVSGFIEGHITAEPDTLYFGQVAVGKGSTLTATLKATGNERVSISRVTCDNRFVRISAPESGKELTLTADILPYTPRGELRATIFLMVNGEKLSIPVFAYIS